MRPRSRKSPWTSAGAVSRPATITARKSWTVRPAPPPESGTAQASSSGTFVQQCVNAKGARAKFTWADTHRQALPISQ